jgi:hypothetical protein
MPGGKFERRPGRSSSALALSPQIIPTQFFVFRPRGLKMSDTHTTTAADPGEFAPTATPAPRPAPQAAPAPAQRVTPGSKEWAQLTTEQRHAQLRGPANPRAQGHSPARDIYEAQARARGEVPAANASDQQPPAAEAGPKIKIGKYEISEAELGTMMDRQAQDDLRKATVPAAPEAYEAKLPADLKLPGGQEYKFDVNDPSLIAARNLAHAKGWSQNDFSEALGIFASHIAGQEALIAEQSRAEIAKAGVNAPQRMDAVTRWITAEVGEADAKPIRATIVTDAHLRFYERVMNKISSQGSASFSQQHRVAPDDRMIPGFDKMSFEQQRFAQDQLAARRGGYGR